MEVFPFVEDPNLSDAIGRAVPQLLDCRMSFEMHVGKNSSSPSVLIPLGKSLFLTFLTSQVKEPDILSLFSRGLHLLW